MTTRAQANLLGFAAAAVVVVTVTVAGVALATDALADADRQPAATRAADRLAAHLVAADAAHTRGRNVLRADATANLTLEALERAVPPIRGRPVVVSVGGETIVERDGADIRPSSDPRGSTERIRVERRVRVERGVDRTDRIDLEERTGTTLPDHTGRVVVQVDTRRTRPVHTVRADGRVILHDPDGLSGRYVATVPDVRPLSIRVDAGDGRPGTVTVSWTATNASVERLVVSVGG